MDGASLFAIDVAEDSRWDLQMSAHGLETDLTRWAQLGPQCAKSSHTHQGDFSRFRTPA